jgi:signal transduction histidine kinase
MLRRFGLLIVLPGVILLGFGLRALDQDRRMTDQQVRDRLARAAELAARTIDQQLANWQQFRSDGVVIDSGPPVKVTPWSRLAYEPAKRMEPAPPVDPILTDAIHAEQSGRDLESAITLYRRATSGTPAIRAVAWSRLAACYRKTGRKVEAIRAYRELLRIPKQRVGPVDAELIARFELCSLGDGDRAAFYRDLAGGRWRLDRARYLFYSDTSREWTSESDPARAVERERLGFSTAIADYLDNHRRFLGEYVAFAEGNEALVLPVAVLRRRLERSAIIDPEIGIALVDSKAAHPSLAARHGLADRDLPWAVDAAAIDGARLYAGADQRRRIYFTLLLLVFMLLVAGTYITARAVKRDLEVARLRNDFVATVSHEFRSPLTAIRQLAELLERGRAPTEEKRREYYGLISRESARLSRLVENLLDFSRIEEGRKRYHFERLETAVWLRELVSGTQPSNVILSTPPALPAVLGDRIALASAVENLLDNAVKYSPPGAPVICEADTDGQQVTIRVLDRGYGIAPEDRAHVFERFYRGGGEISRQVKGAGVGLSLVRQIVEAHGGTVDFETRVGEGSTFRIRLKTA